MILKNNLKLQYGLVLIAFIAIYSITCAPALVWQDSGMIQYRTIHNDIKGGLGLALAHPLYYFFTIAAKYIPIGNMIYRINLVSAVMSALAIANLYLLIKILLKKTFPALIAAVTLGFAHTFWWHATVPESYNCYTAFLLAELIFISLFFKYKNTKYLYYLFFINGLSVAVHLLGIIPLACYSVIILFLFIKKEVKLYQLLVIAGLWLLAASPYLYLIINELITTSNLWQTISSALFGNSWKNDVLNASFSKKIIAQDLLFIAINFPTPNIFLAVFGFIYIKNTKKNRNINIFFITLLLLFLVFAARYTVADRYAFFIPFYCILSILIAFGTKWLQSKINGLKIFKIVVISFTLLTIPTYFVAPKIAEKLNFNIGTRGDIPYRNDYQWFLQPWRIGYYGADEFAKNALKSIPQNSVIYADGTTVYPLLIVRDSKSCRPDVVIITSHGSADNLSNYSNEFIDNKIKSELFYTTQQTSLFASKLGHPYKAVKDDILWKIVPNK